jgi:malate synthase
LTTTRALPPGIEVRGVSPPDAGSILSRAALDFVAFLERGFRARRAAILATRAERQHAFDEGASPDFVPETTWIRADDTWRIAPPPKEMREKRVWITTPPTGPALQAAVSAGAVNVMADFEDGCSPTWANMVEGQFNVRDAIHSRVAPREASPPSPAMIIRPRGWHLDDSRLRVDGQPCAGALIDFGLFLFHNAQTLIARGSGPYFCLPKIESRLEARLWNDVLRLSEDRLSLPSGAIRVACMIETLSAAFEMDEILHELRDHATGLVAGQRDYALSVLRTRRRHHDGAASPGLPDMQACRKLLVATCRRRGAIATGAAADRIPIASDVAANEAMSDRVRRHAIDEAQAGLDGTRVMHPGMAAIALAAFEQGVATRDAIGGAAERSLEARDLLAGMPAPAPDHAAVRAAIDVGVHYAGAWLAGTGSVPIGNRMTDTASAQWCSAWIRTWIESPNAALADGSRVTRERVSNTIAESLAALRTALGEPAWQAGRYVEGARLFAALCLGADGDVSLPSAGATLLN